MVEQATLLQRVFERADEMGLTQDLGMLSGIGDDDLYAIRQGKPMSSSEFEAICRSLAVDSGAMYSGNASDPARSPARFRAATALGDPSPLDVRTLALAAEQGRILGQLMQLMGKEVKLRRRRHIAGIQGTLELWEGGYELGESARAALVPSGGPLRDLPGLLKELGVHLAQVPLSSKHVDAASIWEFEAVPVLLVNAASHIVEHPGALRASLAHELCHLLHDAGERDLTTSVSWGMEGTGNYDQDLEKRARAFAPAFLAPRDMVRAWHAALASRVKRDTVKMVQAMAEHWGLSFEGAVWHAKNCKIVQPAEAVRLAALPRKPVVSLGGFESEEDFYPPAMFHRDLPAKAAPLWQGWATIVVLDALDEGRISVGRARELLTWG